MLFSIYFQNIRNPQCSGSPNLSKDLPSPWQFSALAIISSKYRTIHPHAPLHEIRT